MRYYLFFLCATPETVLVQLCICISLASRGELFVAVSAPESSLWPISYHPIGPLPPCTAPCASTSQGLCCHTKPMMASVSSSVWSCEHLVVHRRGTGMKLWFYLAVLVKVSQISQRHLARRRKVFLQLNQTETKQQVLSRSPDRASLAGLSPANSVQNLQPVASNGQTALQG